jgi:ABC-type sugar transport system substrate-binding protein
MRQRFNQQFPDLTDRRVIDDQMGRLDTHGVSRREFLKFMSASAAVSGGAAAMGYPSIAVADSDTGLAYLTAFMRNEWNQLMDKGTREACKAFGFNYSAFDSDLSSAQQANQFEQQMVQGVNGIILNLADGGLIRRMSQQAETSQIYLANLWDSQPWFTPFDASKYWTLLAGTDDIEAIGNSTSMLCQRILDEYGGGKVAAVGGNPGSTLSILRTEARNRVFPDFPEIEFVGELPGNWNREDSLQAAEALLSRHSDIRGFVAHNDDVALGILAALRIRGLQAGKDVYVASSDCTSEAARLIKRGEMLVSPSVSGEYSGGLCTARMYDVMNGWEATDSERIMCWVAPLVHADNVDVYLARYVDNGNAPAFNYRKMSKVLHPDDWDPQQALRPWDLENLWGVLPEWDNYDPPAAYKAAKANGEWERITALYADHYKIKALEPLPLK